MRALASGQSDAFEAAAQANFSPTALARRTPEQRAELVAKIRSAFGRFEIGEIEETPDSLRIAIHGESGTSAVVIFTFDPAPGQRIAALAIELDSGPPPPRDVDPSERTYTTTDSLVTVGDHVLSARLHAPIGLASFPVVVLVTGSGNASVIEEPYTHILAQAFASRGIGSLIYDKAGTGRSTGLLTGSDFQALGADVAAMARYAGSLSPVEQVGLWGKSQAGWVIPGALPNAGPVRFSILVSPCGVSPFEQVAYFLHRQALSWGLSPAEAEEADRMHRAVGLYYAGRASYRSAQAEVDRHRDEPWFRRVVTHPYWDETTADGRILDPQQLAEALRARPDQFELYRAPSSFRSYWKDYESLKLPTLVIYGSADELVPVESSRPVLEAAFAGDHRHPHELRVFEGASHDIEMPDGSVVPEYLDLMSSWARARFDEAR